MVTEEILATGAVEDIATFIAACAFPSQAFVLTERLPRQMIGPQERKHLLRFTHLSEGIDPGLATSGRVFHEDFELRWEQETTRRTRVIYLGQARELPELQPGKRLEEWYPGLQVCEKCYYLFGEYLSQARLAQMGLPEGQGYYAEVRIPRLLQYPAQARRVQVVAREYSEKQTGRVQLFRFQDLKPGGGAE